MILSSSTTWLRPRSIQVPTSIIDHFTIAHLNYLLLYPTDSTTLRPGLLASARNSCNYNNNSAASTLGVDYYYNSSSTTVTACPHRPRSFVVVSRICLFRQCSGRLTFIVLAVMAICRRTT